MSVETVRTMPMSGITDNSAVHDMTLNMNTTQNGLSLSAETTARPIVVSTTDGSNFCKPRTKAFCPVALCEIMPAGE